MLLRMQSRRGGRMSLRDFIDDARTTATKPIHKRRTDWNEQEMSIALDQRLTASEAAARLGCHTETVKRERQQWVFE